MFKAGDALQDRGGFSQPIFVLRAPGDDAVVSRFYLGPMLPGVPSAPNLGGLSAASNTAGAANNSANEVTKQGRPQSGAEEAASIIMVEVIGYGGEQPAAD